MLECPQYEPFIYFIFFFLKRDIASKKPKLGVGTGTIAVSVT